MSALIQNDDFDDQIAGRQHRWTRAEYERMVEVDALPVGARLELLDGQIVDTSPQKSLHANVSDKAEAVLRPCFSVGAFLRSQKPLALDDLSEPEPDIAVVPGAPGDYDAQHPSRALLVVEVADSSLRYDRVRKARAYARNAIPEYWIINQRERELEVHRELAGEVYQRVDRLRDGDEVGPLQAPDCRIAVADLLS